MVGKFHRHAVVEHAQCALPQPVVAVFLTIFYDAAVDLVDFFKSTLFHHRRDHFTADATRAVADDFLVFDIVVLVAFEFCDEVSRCARIWHDSVFKFSNFRLMRISSVKKHHVIAIFLDHRIDFFGLEMFATADHAMLIHFKFIIRIFKAN